MMDRKVVALRLVVPASGLALLSLFALLWRFHPAIYFRLMTLLGAPALPIPFDDWAAVVGLMHCAQHGVNVYVASRCGTFSYSPLWAWTRLIPTDVTWRYAAGLVIDGAFFASLWLVFRPRTGREAALFALVSLSPMVVYGGERANVDLTLFTLVMMAGALFAAGGARRLGAYALLLLAGLLKFYPLAGFYILVRERPKTFTIIAIATAAIVSVLILAYGREITAALAAMPTPRWTVDGIAAFNLWQGLRQMAPSPTLALTGAMLVALTCGVWSVRLALQPGLADTLARCEDHERILLVLGAAVTASFYFMDQPIAYHGVFLLPVEAGLISLRRHAAPALKRQLTWAATAAPILLWEPAARTAIHLFGTRVWVVYWLARELIGWSLMAVLIAILARFALDGEAIGGLWRGNARLPAPAGGARK